MKEKKDNKFGFSTQGIKWEEKAPKKTKKATGKKKK